MKYLIAAVALTAMLGGGPAQAQTELDHNVQRTWDNLFNPPPPGDPRTNWERRRDEDIARRRQGDRAAYERGREADRAAFCRANPAADGCGRYPGRY